MNTITKPQTVKLRKAKLSLVAADIAAIIKKEGVIADWFANWSKEVHNTSFTASDISRIINKSYNGVISLEKAELIKEHLNLYLQDLAPTPPTTK